MFMVVVPFPVPVPMRVDGARVEVIMGMAILEEKTPRDPHES